MKGLFESVSSKDSVITNNKYKVKEGDIWELGKHRLLCGNSIKEYDIEKLINGESISLLLTDPPYGVNIVNKNGKVGAGNKAKNQVYNKVISDDSINTAKACYEIIKHKVDRIIFWGGNYFTDFLPFSDGRIVWDKRKNMNSNNFADGELAWCSFHTPLRIYHQIWNGMIREYEHEKRIHPTQKPVKIQQDILKDFTKENDKILDLFGGSGSLLIACETTNRICYMNEISTNYCNLIINRWENLGFNNKAKLLTNIYDSEVK